MASEAAHHDPPEEDRPSSSPATDRDAFPDTEPDEEEDDAHINPEKDTGEDPNPDLAPSSTGDAAAVEKDGPPLPSEPAPDGPPLPDEAVPSASDDGWDCLWDANTQAWFFYNRLTGKTQWENPRVASETSAPGTAPGTAAPGVAPSSVPEPPESEQPAAGGYNPAVHGDYDPTAWYAQGGGQEDDGATPALLAADGDPSAAYAATASFNRFTGQFQDEDAGPGRHTDEAKSRRQMNAFFDVDAAANSHDGRSLKAERSNKKPSKSEVKAFKEKRRARKEEKRRAWLRD